MSTEVRNASNFTVLSQREAALARPDNVLGPNSTKTIQRDAWLYTNDNHLTSATINIPWGLERIALEGFQNAFDAIRKDRTDGATKWDPIIIKFTDNSFEIKNGGKLFRIETHACGLSLLQVLFAEFNSTDNFSPKDDGEPVIGMNGLGGKMPGVYGDMTVIAADGIHKQTLTLKDHGKYIKCDNPVKATLKERYVHIKAYPDFAFFHYDAFTSDDIDCFRAHAFFGATTTQVDVIFEYSGSRPDTIHHFTPSSVRQLADMAYTSSEKPLEGQLWRYNKHYYTEKPKELSENARPLLHFIVYYTPDQESQLSIYNGSLTIKGGEHVDTTLRAISAAILSYIDAGIKLNVSHVRLHVSGCFIVEDHEKSFNGNAKSRVESFTPTVKLSPSNLEFIKNWGLRKHVETEAQRRLLSTIDTTGTRIGRKTQYEDLLEANYACVAKRARKDKLPTVLIIVEGKSAQNTAIKYTDNDRDHKGVYPIRGKPLDVSRHERTRALKNKEIMALLDIIGLDIHADYSQPAAQGRLRYDYVYFSTDTDVDGDHIKASLINNFAQLVPSFAKIGRLWLQIYPLILGTNKTHTLGWYSTSQCNKWRKLNDNINGLKYKYGKGLGSFNGQEITLMREKKLVLLQRVVINDGYEVVLENCFGIHGVGYRKNLLEQYDPLNDVEQTMDPAINVTEIVPTYLARYAYAAVKRALPSIDGQKEAGLKIMSAALTKWGTDLDKLITAEAFGGYVKETMGYHPGLPGLYDVIANNTRAYPGAQNMPVFVADGMFADRILKYDSQARYLSLGAKIWWPKMFPRGLLSVTPRVIGDTGAEEEYDHLPQVLCMVAINGARGPSFAWNTFIYPTNPILVADYQEAWLRGQSRPSKRIAPWFRGYKGTVELLETKTLSKELQHDLREAIPSSSDADPNPDEETSEGKAALIELAKIPPVSTASWGRFTLVTTGVFTITNDWVVHVTELTVSQTAFGYAKLLDDLVESKTIERYDNRCRSPDYIEFVIYGMRNPTVNSLKLRDTWKLSNMNLFIKGKVVHFETYEEIIDEFMKLTLEDYKKYLIRDRLVAADGALRAAQTAKFLRCIFDGSLTIIARDYQTILDDCAKLSINYEDVGKIDTMSLNNQSFARYEKIARESAIRLQELENTTAQELWLADIVSVRKYL